MNRLKALSHVADNIGTIRSEMASAPRRKSSQDGQTHGSRSACCSFVPVLRKRKIALRCSRYTSLSSRRSGSAVGSLWVFLTSRRWDLTKMATEQIQFDTDQVAYRMRLCHVCGYTFDVDAGLVLPEHKSPSGHRCDGSGVSAFRSHWSETTASQTPHQPLE
jgi:hypothetical protein